MPQLSARSACKAGRICTFSLIAGPSRSPQGARWPASHAPPSRVAAASPSSAAGRMALSTVHSGSSGRHLAGDGWRMPSPLVAGARRWAVPRGRPPTVRAQHPSLPPAQPNRPLSQHRNTFGKAAHRSHSSLLGGLRKFALRSREGLDCFHTGTSRNCLAASLLAPLERLPVASLCLLWHPARAA